MKYNENGYIYIFFFFISAQNSAQLWEGGGAIKWVKERIYKKKQAAKSRS